MKNEVFQRLEGARRRMLDGNLSWFEENNLTVISAKVEDTPKYGPQCMIILQPETEANGGLPSDAIDKTKK
jgi:hypothetical protein